jgi:hypothetical protein
MKNKIIIKSQNISSFDEQVKEKNTQLSIAPFMAEYFKGKITPSRYLYLTKQYKE